MKQRIFIGSSSEKLKIARAIASDLSADHEPTVWNEGIFDLSKDVLSGLMDRLDHSDAAVFVLAPDDMTRLRDANYKTARDNVVFELGLFIGRLGRERSYFIVPVGEKDLHLPTDLLGLVYASYDAKRSDENWLAAVAPACDQIRAALAKCVQNAQERRSEQSGVLNNARVWMHDYVNKAMKMLLTAGKLPSLSASGIKETPEAFTSQIGRCDVSVRFGQIQTCEATEPGCVVALPANDLFDEECINDPRSALGAYVGHAFPGRSAAIQDLIATKLSGEKHELVESMPKTRSRSYGVGKCVHLTNPLNSQRTIFLVSVTTKRATVGVQSEATFLFAAMKAICREMNDQKLTDLHIPVMGSGHGGLDSELALLYLLLAVRAVLDDRVAGTHLRSVSIVVFQKDNASDPSVSRSMAGRVFAVAKATH